MRDSHIDGSALSAMTSQQLVQNDNAIVVSASREMTTAAGAVRLDWPPPPRIVISTNSAWNIANFRAGLIRALKAEGCDVIAVAPRDVYAERLLAIGCRFIPLKMDNKGTNPFTDAGLLLRYFRLF